MTRAASGIWRPRDSCSTEAALPLMRRMVMARHLFTARAPAGIWRPRDSCSTEVALLMQPVATLQTSWNFCRSDDTMKEARWGNSRVVLLFEVLSATPPNSPQLPSTPLTYLPQRPQLSVFTTRVSNDGVKLSTRTRQKPKLPELPTARPHGVTRFAASSPTKAQACTTDTTSCTWILVTAGTNATTTTSA